MVGHDVEGEIAHPRALISPCLLLLLAEAPGHGYELMERLKPLGFDWVALVPSTGSFEPWRARVWLAQHGLRRAPGRCQGCMRSPARAGALSTAAQTR